MLQWVSDNLTWEQVWEIADQTKRPEQSPKYTDEWKNAEKRIEQWENPLTIIEMIALDSEEMDDEDFDRPV